MEVILRKNFSKLGYKDEVVKVKNGYGLNYLIPRGYAIFATESEKKNAKENIKQGLKKQERLHNEALELAKNFEKDVLEIAVKTNKGGKIFQKIGAQGIIDQLKTKISEHKFYKDDIIFENKIEKIGEYFVGVKLYRDVIAKVKINIKSVESEK